MTLNSASFVKWAGIGGLIIGSAYQALVLRDYATAGTIATAALAAMGFSGKLSVLGQNQAALASRLDDVHAAVEAVPPTIMGTGPIDDPKDRRIAELEAELDRLKLKKT